MTFKFSEKPISASSSQDYCFCMRTSNKNVLVGSAGVLLKGQGHFWLLSNINIEKPYQGHGYGSRFLNYIRDRLWSKDALPIRVHPAKAGSESLRKWYMMRGFKEEADNSTYLVCIPPSNQTSV
jgi:GNAT superfamily N-acetyltransferase